MMSTIKQQTFCHYYTPSIFTTFVAKTIAMKLRSKLIVINLQIHHVKCSRYTEQDYTSKLRGIRVYNRSRCVFSSTVSEGPTTWIERWYEVVVLITSTLFCSIAISYCYCRADKPAINVLLWVFVWPGVRCYFCYETYEKLNSYLSCLQHFVIFLPNNAPLPGGGGCSPKVLMGCTVCFLKPYTIS